MFQIQIQFDPKTGQMQWSADGMDPVLILALLEQMRGAILTGRLQAEQRRIILPTGALPPSVKES